MTNSHLLILGRETGLSPEKLAKRVGISNMTLRRWLAKKPDSRIPGKYDDAIRKAIVELAAEGALSMDSKSLRLVTEDAGRVQTQSLAKGLGLSKHFLSSPEKMDEESLVQGLSTVGADDEKAKEVRRNWGSVLKFKKYNADWKSRISALERFLSPKHSAFERSVAYGSFFYLLCPLDLISDFLPVVGLLDDFAILGIVAAFLTKRALKA